MRDEIKDLQMGSGSTVCSEASTGVRWGVWNFCSATTTFLSVD